MRLTRTKMELVKNALKALPFFTILGGAFFGYLEGQEIGHNVLATIRRIPQPPIPVEPTLEEVLRNIGIGAALGLTGGIALCCFGMVATHHITVVPDPLDRQKGGIGKFAATRFKTYFKKSDVEENVRSTQKMAEKHEVKKREQEAEAKEILKIGTSGIRAKKLGKLADSKKSTIKKRGK